MNGDDIAMLDPKVVANHPVNAGASIIQIVVGEDDQDSVLALLALDQDCVTTEQLKCFHGVVGERNDGIVIAGGVGDSVRSNKLDMKHYKSGRHMNNATLAEASQDVHERVWLLLLAKDGCCRLIGLSKSE